MKKYISQLQRDLLDLAEFVQDTAYEDHRSLSPPRMATMLDLSKRLSSVAERLNGAVTDAPDAELSEKSTLSKPYVVTPGSRSIN